MATHSSVLAWRIPGMGEPGGLPSMGSHRVGHDWNDFSSSSRECVSMICCNGGASTFHVTHEIIKRFRWAWITWNGSLLFSALIRTVWGEKGEDIKPWKIGWSHLFFAAYLKDFQSCVFSMLSLLLFPSSCSGPLPPRIVELNSRGTDAGLPSHVHRLSSYPRASLHESKKQRWRLYPEFGHCVEATSLCAVSEHTQTFYWSIIKCFLIIFIICKCIKTMLKHFNINVLNVKHNELCKLLHLIFMEKDLGLCT